MVIHIIEPMTSENIEIIKQIYEAFAEQDLDTLLTLVDPG